MLQMIDADAFEIPFIESVSTFVDFNLVLPTERVEFTYVCELFHRAVRL
jgi:hypothetical protein